jgi:hypothetical protein
MFEVILPYNLGLEQSNSTDESEKKKQLIEPLQRVSKIVERVKPIGIKVLVRSNYESNFQPLKNS